MQREKRDETAAAKRRRLNDAARARRERTYDASLRVMPASNASALNEWCADAMANAIGRPRRRARAPLPFFATRGVVPAT